MMKEIARYLAPFAHPKHSGLVEGGREGGSSGRTLEGRKKHNFRERLVNFGNFSNPSHPEFCVWNHVLERREWLCLPTCAQSRWMKPP